MLYELIYHSTTARNFNVNDIPDILKKARIHNAQNQITGCLIYHDVEFLQLIEGPEEAIKDLYAQIQKDPRHRNVEALAQGPIEDRAFDDWEMAFHNLDKKILLQPGRISHKSILGTTRYMKDTTSARFLFKFLAQEILSTSPFV